MAWFICFAVISTFWTMTSQQTDITALLKNVTKKFDILENTNATIENFKRLKGQAALGFSLDLDSRGKTILTVTDDWALTLKSPLDREKQQFHNFTVLFAKTGGVIKLLNVTIQVLDQNDNAPRANDVSVFIGCYKADDTIAHINASDPDKGKNGTITYNIETINPVNNKTLFTIYTNGTVANTTHLSPDTTYVMNVSLKDNGSPALQSYMSVKFITLPIEYRTIEQWSTRGYNITKIHVNNVCNITTYEGAKNGVIALDQKTSKIKVNRLVTETSGKNLCILIETICPDYKLKIAYRVTVTSSNVSPHVAYITFKVTRAKYSELNQLSLLLKIENATDACIGLSRGGSRVLDLKGNSTVNVILQRTYYNDIEYKRINSSTTYSCLKRTLSLEDIVFSQHAPTTTRPTAIGTTTEREVIKNNSITAPTHGPTTYVPDTSPPSTQPTEHRPSPTTKPDDPSPTTWITEQSTLSPTTKFKHNNTDGSDSPTDSTKHVSTTNTATNAVIGVLSTIVAIFIVFLVIKLVRRKIRQKRERECLEMTQINSPELPWREIDKAFIATGKELGSGFFGIVFQGTVILDGQSVNCAVKTLKPDATDMDSRDLVNELRIIAKIGHHPNIINLIGASTKTEPPYLLLEFASNGNLLSYLQSHRCDTYSNIATLQPDKELDYKCRLKIAYEVALGMRHLSSKKCVHRDLAARNVLLDENYVAKVTDFGLSRDVYEAGVYQVNAQSKMPLKWMAVESLESMEFTTQSDVWSFAVLIWEIETAGTTPYPGLMGRELFQDLVAGHRLEQPPSCPDELYELMSKCWSRDPASRPTFQDLCSHLETLLQFEAGYEDLTVALELNEDDSTKNTQL